ncbi:MAG: aminotransferase class IV, partial [Candidatus Micrarchaeota archaeon]|nr:aminotransferase class IV [Candidatus Micrarchaeota archaeon]
SKKSEIIAGITRDTVLALAKKDDFSVRETDLSQGDLLSADEVFLTGTATQIMPVTKINARAFPIGPVTRRLAGLFDDAVSGRHPFSKKWLTRL